jgi:hypothetical protein
MFRPLVPVARALSMRSPAARFAGAPAARWASTFYTKEHEYVKVEGSTGTVGITDFAQNALGDIVFVELPNVGDKLKKG